jgi:hypothetical protein
MNRLAPRTLLVNPIAVAIASVFVVAPRAVPGAAMAAVSGAAMAAVRGAVMAAVRGAVVTAVIAASPAAALPLISEVFYDAVGGDDGQSFVELYGDPGSLLDGLILEGINGSGGAVTHSIVLSGVMPADGFFVLADVDASGATLVPAPDAVANFDFQNGPDSVVLRDTAGVVDAVGYGVFGAGDTFAGEGTPAPDAPADSSLARLFANVDTDDNALDFMILDVPTPGTAPLRVPEPGTGALFASALLASLVARGSRAPAERTI